MSGCVIYPPTEFVSAGLTIKDIFAGWLGSENEHFIQYHIKRSIVTLFVHSILPFGYIVGLAVFGPLYTLYKILRWSMNNFNDHPIAKNLMLYCNNHSIWLSVASNINMEYRRVNKIIIDTNSITRIIATDNWIIKVMLYKIQIAHQSDTALIVNSSDTHVMSPTTRGEVQFINIEVKPTRAGAEPFNIRLNALDFKDLQDKISRPITVLQNITFHKTLLDRFIDTFKEQVKENPCYATAQDLDQCIGCMQVPSNVKLTKLCVGVIEDRNPERCMNCYCRPMWCIECMAKWFASRQDENAPETWLSSKCTCPVCRARFCLLDVCLVRTLE
ncbi:hypothetical protein KM043_006492 [Ampulex compressa]|nr:hypothetical protein KM043_006492 [Ampulex compressa]